MFLILVEKVKQFLRVIPLQIANNVVIIRIMIKTMGGGDKGLTDIFHF